MLLLRGPAPAGPHFAFMRRFFILPLFLAIACASATPGAKIPKPKLQIIARTNLSEIVPTVATGIAVRYDIEITNQAQVPITLKRIDLDSMAGGGFQVESKTHIYDVTIAPGDTRTVDFV